MKSFNEILREGSSIDDRKVYMEKDTLWVAYSQGSGMAVPLRDKGYITDKKGDSNEEQSLVAELINFAKKNKPLKSKGNSKMYALPVYGTAYSGTTDKLDIWGGTVKPIKTKAFIVDTSSTITVVTFFKTKSEALAWMRSSK